MNMGKGTSVPRESAAYGAQYAYRHVGHALNTHMQCGPLKAEPLIPLKEGRWDENHLRFSFHLRFLAHPSIYASAAFAPH